jgi:plastocyanin
VVALGAGVSWAGEPTIAAEDGNVFGAPEYNIEDGQMAGFFNNDNATHNVTADDKGPDGKALFRTGNVSGGSNVQVNGTQFLEVGSYEFTCTLHPGTMQATLNVNDGPGEPVPRPSVDVNIKSKKLEKVVKSGKLKVKVSASAPTDADGVSLSAKKGRKGITKKANLDVNAGDSKTAKLKLKKSAAKKLADLEKAKVKVSAEVDFGSPAKASKKLK